MTDSIMGCIHVIQRQARTEAEQQCFRANENFLARARAKLIEAGLDDSVIDDLSAGSIVTMRAGQKRGAASIAGVYAAGGALTKKKKASKYRGTKEVEGRSLVSSMTAQDKLEFICKVAAYNASEYVNADRVWLQRVQPIAKCFQVCCGNNVEMFLEKHGNGKRNFAQQIAPAMVGCTTCKKK